MKPNHNSENPPEWIIPPGWVGGFEQSNPAFAYPDPNLSSLPLLDNMANIPLLKRQQKVLWPEFSWETLLNNPDSRCFQMFSPDISRIGYTDEGRVYSIICPQQGVWIPGLGCLNIEVSVLNQRGWIDEPTRELAADMTCGAKIWFSAGTYDKLLYQLLVDVNEKLNQPFPLTKANCIQITLLSVNPDDTEDAALLKVRDSENKRYQPPVFATHPEAWSVKNVEVKIGPILSTGHILVDTFNDLLMDLFNLASGNLLTDGNILTWDVWVAAPELVDQQEWADHANKWRHSIDIDHGSPTGPGRRPMYRDGSNFYPAEQELELIEDKIKALIQWLEKHL